MRVDNLRSVELKYISLLILFFYYYFITLLLQFIYYRLLFVLKCSKHETL